MDPMTALCLSVPPSLAFALTAWLLRRRLEFALLTFARNLSDGLVAVASRMEDAITTASSDFVTATTALAEAHVKAAKYQARAITVKPKPQEPKAPTIFERWMAREGRGLPQTVVDQVEWACDRLLAGEAGDAEQGDEDAARVILRQYARWVEGAVDAEIKKAATGR